MARGIHAGVPVQNPRLEITGSERKAPFFQAKTAEVGAESRANPRI